MTSEKLPFSNRLPTTSAFTRHNYSITQTGFEKNNKYKENKQKKDPLREAYEIKKLIEISGRKATWNQTVKTNFAYGTSSLRQGVWESGEQCKLTNEMLVNVAKKEFCKYLQENKKKTIYLKSIKDDEIIPIPLKNRWCKERRNKVKKRMAYLNYENRSAMCTMLTATVDPKKYHNDHYYIGTQFPKWMNNFLTKIKKILCYEKVYHCIPQKDGTIKRRIGYEKYRDLEYLRGNEFMEGRAENEYVAKGLIHAHIVFIGANRLMDWRKLRRLWGHGHIYINRSSLNKKVRSPLSYMTKYVTKGIDIKDNKNLTTNALNWFFGLRSYTYSNKLVYPLYYHKEVPDYEPLALVYKKKAVINPYEQTLLLEYINRLAVGGAG